jgi:hypothetical protein
MNETMPKNLVDHFLDGPKMVFFEKSAFRIVAVPFSQASVDTVC